MSVQNSSIEFRPIPVVLESELLRIEPMTLDHAGELFEGSRDPSIWRYLPYAQPNSVEEMRGIVEFALQRRDAGIELPFVMRLRANGEFVGSTRYLDIQPRHRGLEIGWTWIVPAHQRSAVNTHSKFLLMRHAFEELRAIRVSLKTDSRNERSQRAIERIGAKREGVLRNHYIMPDGYYRDSVYYSVIETEWPEVRASLLSMMG